MKLVGVKKSEFRYLFTGKANMPLYWFLHGNGASNVFFDQNVYFQILHILGLTFKKPGKIYWKTLLNSDIVNKYVTNQICYKYIYNLLLTKIK